MGFPIGFCGAITKSGVGYQAVSIIKLLDIKHVLSIASPKANIDCGDRKIVSVTVANLYKQFEKWLQETQIKAIIFEETPYDLAILEIAKRLAVKIYISANWEWGGLSKINWDIVDALIANCNTTKKMLQGQPWLTCPAVLLPVHFDEEEFGKAIGITKTIKTFGHIMGYGSFVRIGTPWDVFSSSRGTGEVIKACLEERTPVKIFAMTKTQYRPHLEELTKQDGIEVIFREYESPADIIKQADVFLQPSHEEGFGRTYFETLNCGRPTITTNWPPMNELCPFEELLIPVEKSKTLRIGPEQRSYQYVIPSYKKLAEKIRWLKLLSSNAVETLSLHIREEMYSRFSFEAVQPKWLSFFGKELEENRK